MSLMRAHQQKIKGQGDQPVVKVGNAGPGGKGTLNKSQLMKLLDAGLSVVLAALHEMKSTAAKIEHKRTALIPEYASYVTRLREKNWKHDLLPWYMLWLFDVGSIEAALDLGLYCIAAEIEMPERFARDVPTVMADSLIKWAEAEHAAERSPEPYFSTMFDFVAGTDETPPWNLPDQIAVKYFKLKAQLEQKSGNLEAAKGYFEKALELGATVKTVLKEITKQVDDAKASEGDDTSEGEK
ncbi:MAG: hypothetical protein JEY79_11145 [Pseudodesulfovibrio sp.]|nr:hypothetical protein [Pseudodesulfovibrio sp.]